MNNVLMNLKQLTFVIAAISIVLSSFGTAPAKSKASKKAVPVNVSDAVVREWNEIAYTTIPPQPPFTANRWMAIVQVAVFESVNAITEKYDPYLGTIIAPAGSSPEAAAIMAAHDVLVGLFPAQAAALGARRNASLALIPPGQAKADGMAVGSAAAAAMLLNRTNDGSTPPLFHLPTNSNPYEWQVYTGCPAGGGAFKHWQDLTPFAIDDAAQFRAQPPPALRTRAYELAFNELQAVGDINSTQRPQDRTDVARLYAIANPPALWNAALLQIAHTRSDEITKTARTMAIMNMAVSDAGIAVFDSKYYYRTWRPITAIPRGNEDSNPWTAAGPFTPLIATPCFPAYPSAHGSLSSSAIMVLERAYGRFGHSVTVQHPSVPGVVLNYSDLRSMIDDISDARVYGGIHFRFDQDAGEAQGDAIGNFVYDNLLRKRGR